MEINIKVDARPRSKAAAVISLGWTSISPALATKDHPSLEVSSTPPKRPQTTVKHAVLCTLPPTNACVRTSHLNCRHINKLVRYTKATCSQSYPDCCPTCLYSNPLFLINNPLWSYTNVVSQQKPAHLGAAFDAENTAQVARR